MTNLQHTVLPLAEPQAPLKVELKKSHIKGMYKLGKVIIPEHPDFPSFKELESEKYINRMIDYMYPDDRGALMILLSIFSVLPLFFINWIMLFVDWGAGIKGAAGAAFRMLQIALKGIVFTIYYSDFTNGKVIHEKIGYDAKIVK